MNKFKNFLGFLNPTKLPFIKQFLGKLDKSTKDHLGKESSGRIGYYCFVFLICFISIWCVVTNTLSYEVITLVTILVGQLALLLNIKKNAEKTPFPSLDEYNKYKIQYEKGKPQAKLEKPEVADSEEE
jgi:hypothetical protein